MYTTNNKVKGKLPSTYTEQIFLYLLLILLAIVASATTATNYNVNYNKCSSVISGQQSVYCNSRFGNGRSGNLLIGRESQIHASSTCGLTEPQIYCNKDRRCYRCDSRKSNVTGQPLHPLLDHSISQVIKRRRSDRQHNVTYARELLTDVLGMAIVNNSGNNYTSALEALGKNMSQQTWWQAENGAENVTIQLNLENEFLFTHLIMHFNSFYPAQASIERSFDFGKTWHVYQYYATSCQAIYPNVAKGPKEKYSDIMCENLPSLEPSDDGELVMRVLNSPTYVADRERKLINTLKNISQYNESVMSEYYELTQIMRLTNLRINLIKLQTLSDELTHNNNGYQHERSSDNQLHLDKANNGAIDSHHRDNRVARDERSKQIYHFGLYDLFIHGSCSCNGHSSRCVRQPTSLMTSSQRETNIKAPNGYDNDLNDLGNQQQAVDMPLDSLSAQIDDMVHGYCECEHNTQGPNCDQCRELYNDWPWRPESECKQCECNGHSDKCRFDIKLFQATNNTSGGVCENCLHNTRGSKCHRCQLGFYKPTDKSINQEDACQLCQCNTEHGTIDKSGFCYQGDHGSILQQNQSSSDNNNSLEMKEKKFLARLAERFSVDNQSKVHLAQCLCKPHVGGINCNECLPGHFNFSADLLNGCNKCTCNVNGTMRLEQSDHQGTVDGINAIICDPIDGKCQCKDNVTGANCDTCIEGFYGLETFGECRPCECNLNLANVSDTSCDLITGQCKCRQNTFGRRCDQCQDGFWSYPDCKPCTCNGHALSCDSSTGECRNCADFTSGPYCDECLQGYYGQPILPLDDSNKLGQSSAAKSVIADRRLLLDRSALIYVPCRACSCPGYGPNSTEYHASACRSSSLHLSTTSRKFVELPVDSPDNQNLSDNQVSSFFSSPMVSLKSSQSLWQHRRRRAQPIQAYSQAFECICKQGFVGPMCESCAQNYWGPKKRLGKDCRMCECNNNWNISAENNCDQDTGKCLKCINNTEGDHCELCKSGYHGDAIKQSCELCQCNINGTTSLELSGAGHKGGLNQLSELDSRNSRLVMPCDRITGKCQCAENVMDNDRCDKCQVNYWNMTQGVGCEPCNCDMEGTVLLDTPEDESTKRGSSTKSLIKACDEITGQCECKSGYGGRRCNQCASGFWGDPRSERKCRACNCNMYGSKSNDCDKRLGICDCLPEMTGNKCEKCATGYYFNRTVSGNLAQNGNNGGSGHEDLSKQQQIDLYKIDLMNEIPSPRNCLRCGECYNQWLDKLNSLRKDTESVSLKLRRSPSFKRLTYNGGFIDQSLSIKTSLSDYSSDRTHRTRRQLNSPLHLDHLSSYSAQAWPGGEADYIERKFSAIVKELTNEKFVKDEFDLAANAYNETMIDLLNNVSQGLWLSYSLLPMDTKTLLSHQSSSEFVSYPPFVNRSLESIGRNLMDRMHYVGWLKQHLDVSLKGLDEDRLAIEAKLLRDSGHPRNSWSINQKRAEQLSNETNIIYREIESTYHAHIVKLDEAKKLYEMAHKYISSQRNHSFNIIDQNSVMSRLKSFSITPLVLVDQEQKVSSNDGTYVIPKWRCSIDNWQICSADIRLFHQQQLPQLVADAIGLIEVHNATIFKAINSMESFYFQELNRLTESLNDQKLHIKNQFESWLDNFLPKNTHNNNEYFRKHNLSAHNTDGLDSYLFGNADFYIEILKNSSSSVRKQTSQIEHMTQAAQTLIKSFELNLFESQDSSDLNSLLASTDRDLASYSAIVGAKTSSINGHLQPIVSSWRQIEQELNGDLWPKFNYLNSSESRSIKLNESIEQLLHSKSNIFGKSLNLNDLTDENSHNDFYDFIRGSYEANQLIVQDINRDNNVTLDNFNSIESVLLIATKVLNKNQWTIGGQNGDNNEFTTTIVQPTTTTSFNIVSRWRTEHNYNLAERVVSNTKKTLEKLNHNNNHHHLISNLMDHDNKDNNNSFASVYRGGATIVEDPSRELASILDRLSGLTNSSSNLTYQQNYNSNSDHNSNNNYIGHQYQQLDQLLSQSSSLIELESRLWSRLRDESMRFLVELEHDYKLMEHYATIERDLQTQGNNLDSTLDSLIEEHNLLTEHIQMKWLKYEKCQG